MQRADSVLRWGMMSSNRKIKVLVAKPGLDSHDRGAKIIARAFRDAGMEVIYTGLRQSPEQIVVAALQEDIDVLALSILSGAHMPLFTAIMERLRARMISDILVIGGGIIPEEDIPELKKIGIREIFGPGTPVNEVVRFVQENANQRG